MGTQLKTTDLASEGTLTSEGTRRRRTIESRRPTRDETHAKTTPCLSHLIGGFRTLLVVAAALCLVHASGPNSRGLAEEKAAPRAKTTPAERAYHGALPPAVVEMREQILAAVHSGVIADLVDAIEWNEIKPDFGPAAGSDPIAYWKRASADGDGREVLSVLANVLALPPARLALGRDPENTMVYVWPYLAELPLDSLKPGEEVDLLRLVPAEKAREMRAAKRWTWWRLAIGADGTWHTFRTYE